MRKSFHIHTGTSIAVAVLVAISGANIAFGLNTCTNNGWWHNDATWDGGIPTPGQDVLIPSGFTVTLSNSTAVLTSFTNAGALVFTSWTNMLTASNVTVAAGGNVTHNVNTDTVASWVPDSRVYIVCTNFMLASNATVNVDKKGYKSSAAQNGTGYGPGGGWSAGNYTGYGASYGGQGGQGSGAFAARAYGTVEAPEDPGSGAGGSSGPQPLEGAGGGAVRIDALGTVTIFGTVTADGGNGAGPSYAYWGGGSGGGIYITCATFAGSPSGLLSADGGTGRSGYYYQGGGGRISVVYSDAGQPRTGVRFSTSAAGLTDVTGMGSLYVPDDAFAPGIPADISDAWIHCPVLNGLELDSLTVDSGIGFYDDTFTLVITNTLTMDTGGFLGVRGSSVVHCASMVLTNGGKLFIENAPCAVGDYSVAVSVSNAMQVHAGSWVYPRSHESQGGVTRFSVGSLTIATNDCGFNAKGRGHAGGTARTANTWGHGNGAGAGPGYGAYNLGASHGGVGGGRRRRWHVWVLERARAARQRRRRGVDRIRRLRRRCCLDRFVRAGGRQRPRDCERKRQGQRFGIGRLGRLNSHSVRQLLGREQRGSQCCWG